MTFKELRQQLRVAKDELDTKNRVINIMENQIICLESENKALNRVYDKCYDLYIKEKAKTNKCRNKNIIICILLIGIICAVAL